MPSTAGLLAVIPNALSVGRMLLGLSFPWIPASWRVYAIVAAALSDLADGASSRQLHVTSPTGRILDPIADKVFVLAVVVTLVIEGSLQLWQVALVGSRDVVVLVGVGFCLVTRDWSALGRAKPSFLGKLATVAQFLFVFLLLLRQQCELTALLVTAGISLLAGAHYLWKWLTKRNTARRRACNRLTA
jgi:phosphatidylglycerophosphate synthase